MTERKPITIFVNPGTEALMRELANQNKRKDAGDIVEDAIHLLANQRVLETVCDSFEATSLILSRHAQKNRASHGLLLKVEQFPEVAHDIKDYFEGKQGGKPDGV